MMRKSKNTKKEIESVGEEYGGHQVNTRVVYFDDGAKQICGVLKFLGHLQSNDDTVYAIVETDERRTCTDTNGILGRMTKKESKKLNISFYRTLIVQPEELMKEEFMYEQKGKEIVNHDLKNKFKETAQRQAIFENEPITFHEVTERLSDLDFFTPIQYERETCYELNLTAPIYTEDSKPVEMVTKLIPRPIPRPAIASYDLFGERTLYEEIPDMPILDPGFMPPWSSSSESATNLQPIDFDEGNDAMSDGNDSMVVEVDYDDIFNEAPAVWSDQPDHHSVNGFNIASNEPFTHETIIAPLKVPAVWSVQPDHHSANGFNIATNEPFTNETIIAPLKVPAARSVQPDHHSANGFNIATIEPFTNETIIAPIDANPQESKMKNEDMVCKNVTGQNSETKDDLLKNFESHYSCPICLDIADDAVECTDCFKIYCGECTEGINTCPSCRCTPSAWRPSRNARQFIGNLKTDCPNDGCKEKPTRSNLQVHLEKCEWSLIACSSDGCDKRIKQSGMVEHLLQCGHCLIKCSSKGCLELVKRKDVEDHKDRCLFTNINCMNCNEMFVRKNESIHLNICKEKIINCMFCGFSDTRMNVMVHSVRVHYEKVAHPFGEMLESIRVHRSVSNHYPSYLPP